MQYLILILLLTCSSVFAQQVYQWTDEQGNTVFSDKPHKDAKQIDIPELPSFESKVKTPAEKPAQKAAKPAPSKIVYETLSIVSPKNEETIWSNPGVILVSVNLIPSLADGDKLVVKLDGNQAGETTSGTSIELSGIDRGTHNIQAQIVDPDGKVVKTSQSVTVYLHKASVNQPSATQPRRAPVIINRGNP